MEIAADFRGLGGKTFMRQKVAEANPPPLPPSQVNASPDAANVERGVPRNMSNASTHSSGKRRIKSSLQLSDESLERKLQRCSFCYENCSAALCCRLNCSSANELP